MTIDTDALAELRRQCEEASAGDYRDLAAEWMPALLNEIDRLRKRNGLDELADALRPIVDAVKVVAAERDRLRALLDEARECEGLQNWYGGEAEDDNLLARIDVALGTAR